MHHSIKINTIHKTSEYIQEIFVATPKRCSNRSFLSSFLPSRPVLPWCSIRNGSGEGKAWVLCGYFSWVWLPPGYQAQVPAQCHYKERSRNSYHEVKLLFLYQDRILNFTVETYFLTFLWVLCFEIDFLYFDCIQQKILDFYVLLLMQTTLGMHATDHIALFCLCWNTHVYV